MNEAGLNPDVIESALAPTGRNKVRKSYNRSTYITQRIELMSLWGYYVNSSNEKGVFYV